MKEEKGIHKKELKKGKEGGYKKLRWSQVVEDNNNG